MSMSKLIRYCGVLSILCLGLSLNSVEAQAVSIYIEDVATTANSSISVDVKVANFTGVAGAQFSLNWDPAELQYTGVSNLALNAVEDGNFNRNLTEQGKLGYIVADMSLAGFDLEDGSVLFTVEFDVIGLDNSRAEINFSDDPVSQVVADTTSATIAAEYEDGSVLIGNVSSTREVRQDDPNFTAHPNPFRGQCRLTFQAMSAGPATLVAFDAAGKELPLRTLSLVAGENILSLNADEFPASGIYFLRLRTESGSYGRKLFVTGSR